MSEQNLLIDDSGRPMPHPEVTNFFTELREVRYVVADDNAH